MKEVVDLINSIKNYNKSKTDNNLNRIIELVQFLSENISLCKEKDLKDILNDFKKIDDEIIQFNNPLNFFYFLVNNKLGSETDDKYLIFWMMILEQDDPFLKQLLIFQALNHYFDEKFPKKKLPKFYKIDEFSSESLKFSSLGLIEDNTEKSMNYFSKALLDDKNNWVASLHLAYYYLDTDNFENSVRQFNKVLKHRKSIDFLEYTADILFELGNMYSFKLNQLKEGEKFYKECIKVNQDLQGLNNNYGYCLFRLRKYKSALTYLRKASKIEEDKETPLWNILRVYKRIKDYDNALKTIKKIKKISKRKKAVEKELNAILNKLQLEDSSDEIVLSDNIILEKENSHVRIFKKLKAISQENILEELIHNRIKRNEDVFQRKLKIYDDEWGYGKQLIMPDVGRLDLLVVDIKTHELIVIELKKDSSYNDVITQIKKYMKWVKDNIAKDNYKVKGLICLHSANTDLIKRAKKERIEIQEYSFNFNRIV